MKSTLSPLLLALALATPAAYAAEDIYRSVMPDGSVRYGESPAPGAKQVRKVPAPPATTGTIVVTPEEKARYPYSSPTQQGGVGVIPQPPHQPGSQGVEQGRTVSQPGLPARSY